MSRSRCWDAVSGEASRANTSQRKRWSMQKSRTISRRSGSAMPDQPARAATEHPGVEIFDEERRANRHEADLLEVTAQLRDIERLPAGMHEFVDEIARPVIAGAPAQLISHETRGKARCAGFGEPADQR